MAYLNAEEREKLRQELQGMSFSKAKGRLARMDRKGKLKYYRTNQRVNQLWTRYDLEGLGTRVTLIETNYTTTLDEKVRSKFELIDVVVEPTPENRL